MTGFTLAALIIFLPLRMWQAHEFTAPYVRGDAMIAEMRDVDVVIVDAPRYAFAGDLVRNDPWLEERPLRIQRGNLSSEHLSRLCDQYRVRFFRAEQAELVGIAEFTFPVTDTATLPEGCEY